MEFMNERLMCALRYIHFSIIRMFEIQLYAICLEIMVELMSIGCARYLLSAKLMLCFGLRFTGPFDLIGKVIVPCKVKIYVSESGLR